MVKHQIITINLTSIGSDEPEATVKCGGCVSCCEKLTPYLTPDEVASGLYPLSLIQPSVEQRAANPNIGPIVALYRKKEGGCGMLIDNKCSIYDYRPQACRQFDCRAGHHPAIPDLSERVIDVNGNDVLVHYDSRVGKFYGEIVTNIGSIEFYASSDAEILYEAHKAFDSLHLRKRT